MTVTRLSDSSAPVDTALWYTRCPVPTASGIAQNKGWLQDSFAEIGVRLDSVIASADRAVRESHFRHSLTGSFREGGNVPPIWTRSRGQDTVVVGITWVDEEQLVLVRAGSGIGSVADLRGRRLGIVRKEQSDLVDVGRAESLRGLLTALRIAGVGRDEVAWVDLEAPEWDLREQQQTRPARNLLVDAVLAGEVDAVFVKGAGVAGALAEGLVPIANLNDEPDPFLRISAGSPRPITVDRATLESAPELVDRYVAVLLRTASWAGSHPEEVVETIAVETGTDVDTVRRVFGPEVHLAFEPSLWQTSVDALRDQKDWLLAEGFIGTDFDIESWIDRSVLERARALASQVRLPALDDRAEVPSDEQLTNQDLDPARLRRAFGTFPTGVVAVAAMVDGAALGLAVSSFTSVSLEPPLISISLAKSSKTWPMLRHAGQLGVTVLADNHASVCRQLSGPVAERFVGVSIAVSHQGGVTLDEGVTKFSCTIFDEVDAGDHILVLLQVHQVTSDHGGARRPLVFHASNFGSVQPHEGQAP